MKKITLILLTFLFTSCGIAQVEQLPLVKTNATVHAIIGEEAVLSVSSELSYTVPAGTLEVDKEYVFWLEVTSCHSCSNKKANVVAAVYTTGQVQKDQKAKAAELSNRRILKQ